MEGVLGSKALPALRPSSGLSIQLVLKQMLHQAALQVGDSLRVQAPVVLNWAWKTWKANQSTLLIPF